MTHVLRTLPFEKTFRARLCAIVGIDPECVGRITIVDEPDGFTILTAEHLVPHERAGDLGALFREFVILEKVADADGSNA